MCPKWKALVTHLVTEVQVNNGNITAMTWIRCFRILSIWMLGLLKFFWWKTLHGNRGKLQKPNSFRMILKVLLFWQLMTACRRTICVTLEFLLSSSGSLSPILLEGSHWGISVPDLVVSSTHFLFTQREIHRVLELAGT